MEKPFSSQLPEEGGRQGARPWVQSPCKSCFPACGRAVLGKGWCWQQLPLCLHRFLPRVLGQPNACALPPSRVWPCHL